LFGEKLVVRNAGSAVILARVPRGNDLLIADETSGAIRSLSTGRAGNKAIDADAETPVHAQADRARVVREYAMGEKESRVSTVRIHESKERVTEIRA